MKCTVLDYSVFYCSVIQSDALYTDILLCVLGETVYINYKYRCMLQIAMKHRSTITQLRLTLINFYFYNSCLLLSLLQHILNFLPLSSLSLTPPPSQTHTFFNLLYKGAKSMTQGVGTACWLAPEVINFAHASKDSDVYAFGIVLWEVFTR